MSTNSADTVNLELSFDELRWLAGAFGAARLPLTLDQAASRPLIETQTLLQQRGLIQRATPGWQMEPFTALLIQWMLGAGHFWLFERFTPDGEWQEFALFKQDNAALLVLPLPQGKRFVVCRTLDLALLEWQLAVDLPAPSEVEILPEWDLPQPVTLIRSAWKHPDVAKKMAPSAFVGWARQLDWAGEWLLVQEQNRTSRLAVAAQGEAAWVGRWTPGKPGEFVLKAWQSAMVEQVFLEDV